MHLISSAVMCYLNFMHRLVEHEKSFKTLGPGCRGYSMLGARAIYLVLSLGGLYMLFIV